MTIASEKSKSRSRRFTMARIDVGWKVPDTEWTLAGFTNAQIWSCPMPYPVAGVQLLGVELDYWPDVALPGNESWTLMSSEAWYWDPDTGTLYVWDANANPPNHASGEALVVDYRLLLSDDGPWEAGESPTESGTYVWEERLAGGVSVARSWEDMLAGVVSISGTSLRILNVDGWFSRNHATVYHSLSQRSVSIWICIDSPENAVLAFEGKVQSVNPISGDESEITVFDALAALNQPAYMGDAVTSSGSTSAIARRESLTALTPTDDGKPIKYTLGLCSAATYFEDITLDGASKNNYHVVDAERALCVSYSATKSTSTNRTWYLGRVGSGGLRTQSIGAVQAESVPAAQRRYVRFASHDLRPGEYVQWANGGNFYFGVVLTVGTFTMGGTPYNCRILDFGAAYPLIGSSTVNAMSVPIVEIEQSDGQLFRISPAHYTRSYVTTSYGNKIVQVAFFNNFEANYSGLSALDPDSHVVRYVTIPAASPTIGTSISTLLTAAGLTVNAASIAAADSALGNLNSLMTIPYCDESDFRTYREYLEDMLRSIGGYVRLNASGEVELKLFGAPSTATTVDEDLVLEGSLGMEVDYQDVVTELQPFNPHIPTWEATNTGDNPNTISRDGASFTYAMFHRNRSSLSFRHVLETITDRVDYLRSLRTATKRTYSFQTATEHLDAELGDDLTLEHELVPGGSVDLKIYAIDKSADATTVRGMELP